MAWFQPKTVLDKVFEYSIILKGIDGLLELLAAILLIFIGPSQIKGFVSFVTQKELLADPSDPIANLLVHATAGLQQGAITFAVIYLLIHAIIKLVAVFGLLRNKLWAYPFSLITLGLLVVYQVYDIIVAHSIGMVLLTIFDVFILWLIWREYGKVRESLKAEAVKRES